MQKIESLLSTLNSFVWGPAMLFFILCTGLYLMLGLRLLPLRKLGFAFGQSKATPELVSEAKISAKVY